MRSPAEVIALHKAISPDRFATYRHAADVTGCDVLDLYIWDRDLAAALLADIAILEVALRNAIHSALTLYHGTEEWYADHLVLLDDRSTRALAEAWKRLPKGSKTAGRMIARLMFGFWTGMLDTGGHTGPEPRRIKCDYENMFRTTLSRAFPGGKAEARSIPGATFDRPFVHDTVSTINDLRNRAAHHEPVIGGFPRPGQRDSHGAIVRLTVEQGHEACLRLARMLDRDLASWLQRASAVPDLLANRP